LFAWIGGCGAESGFEVVVGVVEVCEFDGGGLFPYLICISFVNIGCVILFDCKVINGNGNKNMKTNPVSKRAKTGPSHSEKWHGTHQKNQSIFQIKIRNPCTKQAKIWWDPHFLVYKQENCF
jgi:hypothetical protein